MKVIKVIVGLGNPGNKYTNNRHNVGSMFIDYLKAQNAKFKRGFKLEKTGVFMNQSGQFVKKLKIPVENLIIAHDDLDIPIGKFKIQKGSGPKLHNGLKSIEDTLNSEEFWRIRIGVENRISDEWVDGETYVLSDFTKEEREIVEKTFEKIVQQLTRVFS